MKKINPKPAFKVGEIVIHQGDERIVEQIFGRIWEGELSVIPEFAYLVVHKNYKFAGYLIKERYLQRLDEKD